MTAGCQHCTKNRAGFEVRTVTRDKVASVRLCGECAEDWRALALAGAPEFDNQVPDYQRTTPL